MDLSIEKIPFGKYKVRFKYGDATQLLSYSRYNGHDYMNTKYNGKIADNYVANLTLVLDVSGSMAKWKFK